MRAIALTGPTASGKTALSLAVASALGCEIISLDSMQIYRGMDIGTAKATAAERSAVPHHMLDIASPAEIYSAEDYRLAALECARGITARGGLPLFVGGTGLYLDTLIRGTSPLSPPADEKVRARLAAEAASEGGAHRLWLRLSEVDPESAEKTHENNLRRVVRALEIYELTGKSKTYFDRLSRVESRDISFGHITLDFHNRETLYSRVNERVDAMLADGLLEEVRALFDAGLLSGDTTAAQAIGYKEIAAYLRGEITLSEAVELIKLSSRRYAKRQLTWFRHNADAVRLFVDNEDGELLPREQLASEAIRIFRELVSEADD
ncbi:MAG: tRNA (adenosine(37)-N6)-dimethylallyltransferase MiaA [Clostridia bacterium]|nr:tRNA (adenosine(37)-N6)-dimethylallyltransferase MiaA [Clostridia bacterium]